MLTQPALIALPRAAWHRPAVAQSGVLTVEAIGHLVPRRDFAGQVHSTFAHACNIACGDSLLTLVTQRAGNGPSSLRLAADAPPDLRRCFEVGQAVVCRNGIARTLCVEFDLATARVWRPAPRRTAVPASLPRERLQRMTTWLAQQRRDRHSIIDGAAVPVTTALIAACRALDCTAAAQHATRLVGWGEGLTPAGDDFLVGACAGFDAAPAADPSHTSCRAAIADALIAALPRTTRISAHQLRLAAHGHHNERVLAARDALLSDVPWTEVDPAWRAACAIGATSGADTLAGLLAALALLAERQPATPFAGAA